MEALESFLTRDPLQLLFDGSNFDPFLSIEGVPLLSEREIDKDSAKANSEILASISQAAARVGEGG